MNSPLQLLEMPHGPLAVREDGVVLGNLVVQFRKSRDGFTRKDLGALFALHPNSFKRFEHSSGELAAGRTSKNKRVLHYSAVSGAAFAKTRNQLVDIVAAISLGFPLDLVEVCGLGYRESQGAAGKTSLTPLPAEIANEIVARWARWQLKLRAPEPQTLDLPCFDTCTASAISALVETSVPDEKIVHWARVSGHSEAKLRNRVAKLGLRLRQLLKTPQGRLRLTMVFEDA